MFFIPIGTTRPKLRHPYATYALLAVNFAIFVAQMYGLDLTGWEFVPAQPTFYSWLTAMFLHADPMHLFGNMLFLWIFGTVAEDVLGAWVFLGIYIASGMGAIGLDVFVAGVFAPAGLDIPRLGASGAIAGIMGLSAICFTMMKVKVWYFVFFFAYLRAGTAEVPAPVFMGLWVGWEILQGTLTTYMEQEFGYAGGVAHWAHVGGFAIGLFWAFAFKVRRHVVKDDLFRGRRPATDPFEAASQAAEIERIAKESPDDPESLYALGRALEISGRQGAARDAYERAMVLFLRFRRPERAVRAYRAIAQFDVLAGCPDDVQFSLAVALERGGLSEDAYRLFRQIAQLHQGKPRAETALFRAGEIAHTKLSDDTLAKECFNRLLNDYPYGTYRSLCKNRIRQIEEK